MKKQSSIKILSVTLAAGCWLAQQAWAQSAAQSPAPQAPATGSAQAAPGVAEQGQPAAQTQAGQQKGAEPSSATAKTQSDASQDLTPSQPVTTYPDASGAQKAHTADTNSLPAAPQPKSQPEEPQGAATAEKVSTAGGAAAKPAGVAIAPAKQHRTRSILIKVGALAAAGVAAGTVYALSRSTPSVPPGSNSPIAVPK
jgi:hypothetical protein